MRIGIEVQRLFRKEKFGIETSALQLIKKLQAAAPEHEFIIFVKDDNDKSCLQEQANLKIKNVHGRLFVDFEQIFLPLATRHEKVDLLHCTGNTTPYFSPVPIVQTLHDVIFMDPISQRDSWYQRFGNLYRRKLVPIVTPKSKAIITVSHYEKQRIIKRLNIPEEKITVIYNGLDEERFRIPVNAEEKMRVSAIYKLPKEYILYLGNMASRKNSLRVIEAYCKYAARVENPIPIVTPGLPKKFICDYLRTLNTTLWEKNFITPGYIKAEDLPYVYNLSTLFLFPSIAEGFGMPIVEAMACGAPVITSNTSSMPEIAGNAALLINPLSISSIADGLLQLLNDENKRQAQIHYGLHNAKRFSWNNAAEQILQVYDHVLYPVAKMEKHHPAPVTYPVEQLP